VIEEVVDEGFGKPFSIFELARKGDVFVGLKTDEGAIKSRIDSDLWPEFFVYHLPFAGGRAAIRYTYVTRNTFCSCTNY